jgi:hypothetical protein
MNLHKEENSVVLNGEAIFNVDPKNRQAFETGMVLSDDNKWTHVIISDDKNTSATFEYGHYQKWYVKSDVEKLFHFVIDYQALAKRYIVYKGEQFVLAESGNQLVITFDVKTPKIHHEYPFSADIKYEIGILSADHKKVIIVAPYTPVIDKSKNA